jgi:hypothetical protein
VSAPQADVADASCARVAHHLRGKLQLHPGSPCGASSCPASAARAVHPQGLPLQDASRRLPRLRRRLLARQGAAPCPSPPATCDCKVRRAAAMRRSAPASAPSGRSLFLLLLPPAARSRNGWRGGEGKTFWICQGQQSHFVLQLLSQSFFSKFIQSSLAALRNEGRQTTRIQKIGANVQSQKKRSKPAFGLKMRAVMQFTQQITGSQRKNQPNSLEASNW